MYKKLKDLSYQSLSMNDTFDQYMKRQIQNLLKKQMLLEEILNKYYLHQFASNNSESIVS